MLKQSMEREVLNRITLTSLVYGWLISYKGSWAQLVLRELSHFHKERSSSSSVRGSWLCRPHCKNTPNQKCKTYCLLRTSCPRKQCLDEANLTVQQAFFFKDQGLGVPYQENLYIWDLCSDSSDNLRQMQRKFKNYLKIIKSLMFFLCEHKLTLFSYTCMYHLASCMSLH